MNILDQTIPDAVAEAILAKVVEAKAQLEGQVKSVVESEKAKYGKAQKKLFKQVDKLVESATAEVKEEYSARMLTKLKEKNEQIRQLEEEKGRFKEELTERVHTFLSNSKEEVRTLVEEEVRLDGETMKAQRLVDEVRALIGGQTVSPASAVDESKVSRLEEDVKVLKERLDSKTTAITKLKVQLKVRDLVESVPSADRDFYVSQLAKVQSVTEAEETFGRIKKVVKQSRDNKFKASASTENGKGQITEEKIDTRPVTSRDNTGVADRMKTLAGL
jgi:hypothetical protein